MAHEHLATYLNDHLAGSVAAIELLEYLEKAHEGTATEWFFAELRADVETDRRELEVLMDRLRIAKSLPRKVTAWITEKVTQLKLRLDDPKGGPLRLLEALEVLALGIEGKRALWRALATAADAVAGLQGIDYEHLARRAEKQRERVEQARLEAARAAFGPAP